jgi:hypothetical protein
VSEAQYEAFAPPAMLRSFPQDLADPALEFSGIYEDGWISEESFFVLGSTGANRLRIVGVVPLIQAPDFTTTLEVRIDGVPAASRQLALGTFSLEVPLAKSAARKRRIELRFSRAQALPGGDGRMTAGRLFYLGLVSAP